MRKSHSETVKEYVRNKGVNMGNFFRRMFSSLGSFLIGVHFIGAGISFLVFSYQYAREHGFVSWLVLGEVVPALKAIVWEVFLVLALIQGPVQNQVVTSITEDFWWMSEYPILVRVVNTADDSFLTASYRAGSEGKREVRLSLFTTSDGGLVLRTELPKESLFTIDPETGKQVPGTMPTVVTIRDHNLDGAPDDFYIQVGDSEMEIGPSDKEELTPDGFVKFRDSPDHQFILIKWSIGIAFCVNHFLHGVDSVFPSQ